MEIVCFGMEIVFLGIVIAILLVLFILRCTQIVVVQFDQFITIIVVNYTINAIMIIHFDVYEVCFGLFSFSIYNKCCY